MTLPAIKNSLPKMHISRQPFFLLPQLYITAKILENFEQALNQFISKLCKYKKKKKSNTLFETDNFTLIEKLAGAIMLTGSVSPIVPGDNLTLLNLNIPHLQFG